MTEEEAKQTKCVPVARAMSGVIGSVMLPKVEHWIKENPAPPDLSQFWDLFWLLVPHCIASRCQQWRHAYKPGHDGFCGLSGGVNTSYGAPPGLEDGPTEPPTPS